MYNINVLSSIHNIFLYRFYINKWIIKTFAYPLQKETVILVGLGGKYNFSAIERGVNILYKITSGGGVKIKFRASVLILTPPLYINS